MPASTISQSSANRSHGLSYAEYEDDVDGDEDDVDGDKDNVDEDEDNVDGDEGEGGSGDLVSIFLGCVHNRAPTPSERSRIFSWTASKTDSTTFPRQMTWK